MSGGPEPRPLLRIVKRVLLTLLVLFLLLAALAGYVIWRIETPYRSPASVSPDGRWRAWLERPDGSMQPMFYGLRVKPNGWFVRGEGCEVASVYNYHAERYTRLRWTAPARLTIDYGLAARDTTGVGTPNPFKGGCPPIRLTLRRDRTLDAAADLANATNHEYAVPIPDRDPF